MKLSYLQLEALILLHYWSKEHFECLEREGPSSYAMSRRRLKWDVFHSLFPHTVFTFMLIYLLLNIHASSHLLHRTVRFDIGHWTSSFDLALISSDFFSPERTNRKNKWRAALLFPLKEGTNSQGDPWTNVSMSMNGRRRHFGPFAVAKATEDASSGPKVGEKRKLCRVWARKAHKSKE